MEYKISQELAQAILNYLSTRPYSEVFQLIGELTKLDKIEAKETTKKA